MPEKATRAQIRRHNRQLVLRFLYLEEATNRAALAQKTGLTKPAVSTIVAELIEEGLIEEIGLGESTDSGGKRPRLLRFVPEARQVVGIEIAEDHLRGVLTNLDGQVIVQHHAELEPGQKAFSSVFPILLEVINGLIAQCSAPLLCIGAGVPGLVDTVNGEVIYSARFGWHEVALAEPLQKHYRVPVYVSNDTQLASMAQYAFGNLTESESVNSFATVLVGGTVGMGLIQRESRAYQGGEISFLRPDGVTSLADLLGWDFVRRRMDELRLTHADGSLYASDLSYLYIRQAVENGSEPALVLWAELSESLATVFAWVIALTHPEHISLAGRIADLGEGFLARVIEKTGERVLPYLLQQTGFSVDDSANLVSIGAAATSVQHELGLV